MARMKPKTGGRIRGKTGAVKFRINPTRGAYGKSSMAFEACAFVGSGKRRLMTSHYKRFACGWGKNPRKALASALKKLSSKINSQKGAYAGVR